MSDYRPYSPPPRPSLGNYVLPLLLLLALALLLVWRFWPGGEDARVTHIQPRTVAPGGKLADAETAAIELYKSAAPSVVNVTSLAALNDPFRLDLDRLQPRGAGSGFVWDQDGHIVTNYHVVQKAAEIRVTLANRRTYPVTKWAGDPDMDLAVLKINANRSELTPIPIGESSKLKVGQWAFAIGNPFGLDQSFAMGVVSALGREITSVNRTPIKGVIQTTAPINPGNSGGPLLDSSGRLIGVNTAILSPSGAWAGIGFAIPVDEVNQVVTALIRRLAKKGPAAPASLGITEVPEPVARRWGIASGVVILNVEPDGAAEQAGLLPTRRTPEGILVGDVIVKIDNTPIRTRRDLASALEEYEPGQRVTVTVQRGDRTLRIPVTLQAGRRR
ncbi:MAG: trypsin-like peptidase domain-containing protein [Gemmataceae bacterium]|nr:trypsin-like peptidase domain-containing protein [Gemmataceae bacterium]